MKLFKSLLVAPATLGLLAPLSATANEINLAGLSGYSSSLEVESINDFNPAKEIAVTNSRVDGLEARLNNFEAGSFSETTTASFSLDFGIGALDGKDIETGVTDGDEDFQAAYGFQIDLNTSFTGEDSLDIAIDAGNGPFNAAGSTSPLAELDFSNTTDALVVDGVSYTFPVGDKTTVIVGDNTDGSALFTTACAYGGPSTTLDDCGNVNAGITNGGFMVGASYDIGNGFTAAVGFAGPETGIMTQESNDAFGANLAYTADTYGLSFTYGVVESTTVADEENTYTAFNAYWTPEGFPSVSAGYELGDIGGAANNADESINYFLGLEFANVGPGTFGAALGTSGGQLENQTEELMYEAYYTYPVNDNMEITPLVYIKEQATDGTPDQTGFMVKTSFSF